MEINKQKGRLGEEIARQILKDNQCKVQRSGACFPGDAYPCGEHRIDFVITDSYGYTCFVEVKAQQVWGYTDLKLPTYSFPEEDIDTYISIAAQKNLPLFLAVVDASAETMFFSNVADLMKRQIITRSFPANSWNNELNCYCYYFHQDQFKMRFPITDTQKLRRLKELYQQSDAEDFGAARVSTKQRPFSLRG